MIVVSKPLKAQDHCLSGPHLERARFPNFFLDQLLASPAFHQLSLVNFIITQMKNCVNCRRTLENQTSIQCEKCKSNEQKYGKVSSNFCFLYINSNPFLPNIDCNSSLCLKLLFR